MPHLPSESPLLTKTVTVESSALANVAYDYQRDILQVAFHDSSIYHYPDVPSDDFEDLLQAESSGGYLNSHIRGRFPHLIVRAARQ